MKNFKWFLTVTSAIVALILASCAPGILPIASVTQKIVEVTAEATDSNLLNLAGWCKSKPNILMLWYDLANQPDGFDSRNEVFSPRPDDKNVYLNNVYVGNYGINGWQAIRDTIEAEARNTTFNGNLILYLRANDLLGTSWDLIIGEKVRRNVTITTYVLVEFQKQGSVYKVTKVQVRGEWEKFAVPKDKSWDEIGTKGFAFFRIDYGKVVDARVISPK